MILALDIKLNDKGSSTLTVDATVKPVFAPCIHCVVGADMTIHEGSCLCGAVRFKAEGDPVNVRVCHCRLCQKAMGGPFFARALFDQKALTIEGPTGRYPSSDHLERLFCQQCGTRLGARRKNGTMASIALALFDDRNAFSPTEHIWVSEKVDWLHVADDLPQFREGPP
jgi:hypothetical protein